MTNIFRKENILDDDDSVNNNDVGWQRCLLEHLSN